MGNTFQDKISMLWDMADLLRGSYKRSEYQKAILPFVVLKRFDDVMSDYREDIRQATDSFNGQNWEGHIMAQLSRINPQLRFANRSQYDFGKLLEDPDHIEQNMILYLDSFTSNVREIFEHFEFKQEIAKLAKANKLYLLLKKFNETRINLHPSVVSNFQMGLIFEELVRKFAEASNEEAGEHFTPRDVIDLMTALMFIEDDAELHEKHKIKFIYDPACGTGGMLTNAKKYIHEKINPDVQIVLYGQELNPQTYAIAKADILIKGENADTIQGPRSTLSEDAFPDSEFDYILSNPPYGTKWEADKDAVLKEAERGEYGRFEAGTPRINDGQLLFVQHMISKMKTDGNRSRISLITNGSPLFTGDAGSGESEIRKWILENDYLEAIIALPNQLFYNTGINTYIWILSNQKSPERQGKVQLVNGVDFWDKMRKSLGDKRHYLTAEHQETIINLYHDFTENEHSKIFESTEFGYTKVTVERPQQFTYQVTQERLESLYTVPAFAKLADSKAKDPITKEQEESQGREYQESIITALSTIGDTVYENLKEFTDKVDQALADIELKPKTLKKYLIQALSQHDDTAPILTDSKGRPQADTSLRDYEKISLGQDIDEYFFREVLPYYPNAWMERSADKIGYEINFSKYFYTYTPPRSLQDIEADIEALTRDIDQTLAEEI